jgi:hypothetical protein
MKACGCWGIKIQRCARGWESNPRLLGITDARSNNVRDALLIYGFINTPYAGIKSCKS